MRKLFDTDGIRGIANVYPITPEIALQLGKAIAYTMKASKGHGNPKIVIGKDTRLSGYMIENALAAGIVSMGVDVYLLGPAPTPAVALLTKSINASAGIMITASHNPSQDNGIKIFDCDGFKLSDEDEERIEQVIFSNELDKKEREDIIGDKIGKAFRLDEARGRYIEFAKSTIKNFSLKGLKIVLDCANGAAYYVAPRIFSELGADVVVINDKPDGLNINLGCGAIHPEMAAEKVRKEKADVAIILDGDADRLIIADEKGEIVDGDYILTFCAKEMMGSGRLSKDTLVVTEYSNVGVDEAMVNASGKVIRTKNGDRYVLEAMRKHKLNLGGEFTGHMIFSDYATTGDGIISALQLLRLVKEKVMKVSDLKSVMRKYPLVIVNVNVKKKIPFEEMPDILKKINDINSSIKGEGRSLVRYSGTQNVCRIMIEGKDEKKIGKMADELAAMIKKEIGA